MKLHRLTLLSLMVGSVGCDQATKQLAIGHLKEGPTTSYLGDLFRLTYAENSGAFLGLGGQLPSGVRTFIFVGLVSVMLAMMAWMLRRPESAARTMGVPARAAGAAAVALALVLAGGVGNLIDRVAYGGVVVDFLNLGIGGLRTGIFNVADLQIVAGIVMLAWLSLRHREAATSG